MSYLGLPDRRTDEERAADHERWVAKHYLEAGKPYKVEVNQLWEGNTPRGFFGSRPIYRWSCVIWQGFSPWSIAASKYGFRTKGAAERWGHEYVKRGGPPEGFFDPPPPNPNILIAGSRD